MQLAVFIHDRLLSGGFLLNILAFGFHGLATASNTLVSDVCGMVLVCHTYGSDSQYTTRSFALDTF